MFYRTVRGVHHIGAVEADCADIIAQHRLDPATARLAVEAMLADQPLPLIGKAAAEEARMAD